jgi:hypothetical protein
MPKPPKSTPHSDLDGVREDQVDQTDAASATGGGAASLEAAGRGSKARPEYRDDRPNRDDRSR